MTYGEIMKKNRVEFAEEAKNRVELESSYKSFADEIFTLRKNPGGGTIVLTLAEMFAIADYVKKNFPERVDKQPEV